MLKNKNNEESLKEIKNKDINYEIGDKSGKKELDKRLMEISKIILQIQTKKNNLHPYDNEAYTFEAMIQSYRREWEILVNYTYQDLGTALRTLTELVSKIEESNWNYKKQEVTDESNNTKIFYYLQKKETENIYPVDEKYFISKENEENNVLLAVKHGKKDPVIAMEFVTKGKFTYSGTNKNSVSYINISERYSYIDDFMDMVLAHEIAMKRRLNETEILYLTDVFTNKYKKVNESQK